MIREPYNISPYNKTLDLLNNPTFSFTFGGDALVGYDLRIIDNGNKSNIIRDWICAGSSYNQLLFDDIVYSNRQPIENPIYQDAVYSDSSTVYNDEDFSFSLPTSLITTSTLYNNKGIIWQLRLFEDNKNPTNVIQTGYATDILNYNNYQFKGTITGLLEESDESIFANSGMYDNDQWLDENGEVVNGKKPVQWTRNAVKINNNIFPITDYETHLENFFTTSKPDTYFLGKIKSGQSPTSHNCYKINKEINLYNPSLNRLENLQSISQTRKQFSFDNLIACEMSKPTEVFSLDSMFTDSELLNSSFNSLSYKLGPEGAISSTLQVYNSKNGTFETTEVLTPIFIQSITENQNGSQSIDLIQCNRADIGLSKSIVLWNGTSSKTSTQHITRDEYNKLKNFSALASTLYSKAGDAQTYGIYGEDQLEFNEAKEEIIYTVEKDEDIIHYGKTTSKAAVQVTREMANDERILETEDKQLIIKSTTDNSVDTQKTYFTYDEIQNFKANDYGLYTITTGLTQDRLNTITPQDAGLPQEGHLSAGKEVYFTVLNNYYDSNFYYFTNQTQPDLYYQINAPFYTYGPYLDFIATNGQPPKDTISGVSNYFLYQNSNQNLSVYSIDSSIGSEDNPLVLLQRYCTLSSSTAGYLYNFKYYKYQIFGGYRDEKATTYDSNPVYISDKIFSRNVVIDYNNFVKDYDIYKIELMMATAENGFYYYYTYILPTVDMFQDDEDDFLFATVSYDEDRGAAKLKWVKENAYPPVTKNIDQVEYGVYKIKETPFTLHAWRVADNGYMSYYHKGGEALNITPLHDFQFSFAIDKTIYDLDKITIPNLITFHNTIGSLIINIKIENNQFRIVESGGQLSQYLDIIDIMKSIVDVDNDEKHKNKIYQYQLPSTGNLIEDAFLAPDYQDLKQYIFHFYLFPYSLYSEDGSSSAKISYRVNRIYNANSEATKDLILYPQSNQEDWQAGFYGEGSGYNAEFGENGGILVSGPDSNSQNFDTTEYLSASKIIGGIKNANQNLTGLTRITLQGPAYYFGILDVNMRGVISSEDNFSLNMNDGMVASSSLNRVVNGYRIFRNRYETDNLNRRDAAINFCQEMKLVFLSVCGSITDPANNPVTDYSSIVNGQMYVTERDTDGYPTKYISGKQLKALINSSFDDIRKSISEYYAKWDINIGLNALDDEYDEIYEKLQSIQKPDITDNDMIADIDVMYNSITEEDGFYVVYDYTVPNRGYFRYQIVPMLADKTYNVLIAKKNDEGETVIEIDDENWHMTNVSLRNDGSYQPIDTWTFLLGVQTAAYNQNFTKTTQTGFAPYPKIITSLANYKTTNFSGYLGKFKYGENGMANTYTEDIKMIEDWNKFAYENNQILVKDPKGHVFIAAINSTTDSSDIQIAEMPTQVNCSLTQVGDTTQYKVYTT